MCIRDRYQPARGERPEVPGGIGEEDIVYLVLPYIHTAREGVERLGKLLETYGTYAVSYTHLDVYKR